MGKIEEIPNEPEEAPAGLEVGDGFIHKGHAVRIDQIDNDQVRIKWKEHPDDPNEKYHYEWVPNSEISTADGHIVGTPFPELTRLRNEVDALKADLDRMTQERNIQAAQAENVKAENIMLLERLKEKQTTPPDTTPEVNIVVNASEAVIEEHLRSGWDIQHIEFEGSVVRVVFVRGIARPYMVTPALMQRLLQENPFIKAINDHRAEPIAQAITNVALNKGQQQREFTRRNQRDFFERIPNEH